MNFKEVQELIKLIADSNLSEFKMEDGGFKISIRTDRYTGSKAVAAAPQSVVAARPAAPTSSLPVAASEQPDLAPVEESTSSKAYLEVKSPIVGTFYRSPGPDKPPFVKVGDVVQKGQVVCIVEAMKLFNEIESEVSGKVVKVMVEDNSPVEYDQALFLLEP
jgi:acetyl-CoA carboxylase biotin carboxyl carrier protein